MQANTADMGVSNPTVISATQMTASLNIHNNATPGPVTLTILTTNGLTNPITFTITAGGGGNPPTLTTVVKDSREGNQFNMILTGTNFITGANITTSSTGVQVQSVQLISPTRMSAIFVVEPTLIGSDVQVMVVTSGGTSNPVTVRLE